MRTPILSLGATSSSIACMIEGTPAITIALSIQKPGAPDTLLRMRSAPLGMRVMRRRASFIWAPVFSTHSCKMSSARVDRHTERLRHAVGSDVTVGRPDSAGGEDIGVAMPERIECIDDRFLLIADHPHFLEIDADRSQTFRDIADVLVLGAAGQDLAADHQERGRDNLFGSGRVGGWHETPAGLTDPDEPLLAGPREYVQLRVHGGAIREPVTHLTDSDLESPERGDHVSLGDGPHRSPTPHLSGHLALSAGDPHAVLVQQLR